MTPMIVTIDGPAGAGKSSVARLVAAHLGFRFLDTGAMYRAVTLAALRAGLKGTDGEHIHQLAKGLSLELRGPRTILNGQDVSTEIRTPEVSSHVHLAADNAKVRQLLVEMQRCWAGETDVVAEGRDQGTVAFPQAECKIFLTASAGERARRRHAELVQQGQSVTFEEVLAQQEERDRRDASRPVGALVRAADAVEVVTDGLTFEQVVDMLVDIVKERQAELRPA